MFFSGKGGAAAGGDEFAVQLHPPRHDLTAKGAGIGGTVFAQQNGVPFGKNLQRGVGGNIKGAAQFLGQDHTAQRVNMADDPG